MRLDKWCILLLPAIVFLAIFFVYPLLFVAGGSLPKFSFVFYKTILTTPVYLKVLWLTFETAGMTTMVCLILGYPYAYAMARSRGWMLIVLTVCLLLPFWVSLLLRTFSWMILLQDTGLINRSLIALGLIDQPVPLMRNTTGVTIGMTHILLPYVVLPIYSVMRKVEPKLLEAASILGARPVRAFFRIYFPLTLPGVFAATQLCLTLGLGFYVTPALLGGARNTLIAQLIASQVTDQLRFDFASALAVVLLMVTGLLFGLFALFLRLGRHKLNLLGT